jgi:hypothetical protein
MLVYRVAARGHLSNLTPLNLKVAETLDASRYLRVFLRKPSGRGPREGVATSTVSSLVPRCEEHPAGCIRVYPGACADPTRIKLCDYIFA